MRYIFLQLPAYSIYLERCRRCEVKNAIISDLSLQVKLEKKLKLRKKMIESEYKRFLWDGLIQSSAGRVSRIQGIKWMSRHFAENWKWHSSFDRVGMGWEFQQITELWIRVVYLRAKCQKRLSVIRKKQRRIKKTSKTYMWQFVNRRAHQRWNIALHATTKRTSASKSVKFSYSSPHMKQNYSIFSALKMAL